ncbi:MAG: hypothetical protein QOC60_540 [Frankiaceae bacterium]|nr:hypothetical protein [Frankiaceae bacterium]
MGWRRALAGPLLLLMGAWLFAPAAVPLFDGVGFPDEPYRWVVAPAGATKTVAPVGGQSTAQVKNGANTNDVTILTVEQGPQFQLFVPLGYVIGPPTATKDTLTVVPVAGDAPLPTMTFASNVYRLTATSDVPGPISVTYSAATAGLGGTVQLRRATAGDPVMVYRASSSDPWRAIATLPTGADVYGSDLVGLGDYALAFGVPRAKPVGSGLSGTNSGVTAAPLFWLGGAFLVVLVLIVVGLRLTRPSTE